MTKSIDKVDIALHTIPTFLIAIGMGFLAAFGLRSTTSIEMWAWLICSLAGFFGFAFMWFRREQRQHDGHLGGTQSKLEAYIPIAAGTVAYLVSSVVFFVIQI